MEVLDHEAPQLMSFENQITSNKKFKSVKENPKLNDQENISPNVSSNMENNIPLDVPSQFKKLYSGRHQKQIQQKEKLVKKFRRWNLPKNCRNILNEKKRKKHRTTEERRKQTKARGEKSRKGTVANKKK